MTGLVLVQKIVIGIWTGINMIRKIIKEDKMKFETIWNIIGVVLNIGFDIALIILILSKGV